jgi:elongation factor P--(R)-beta-lysine ligase
MDWRPSASLAILRKRAALLAKIRHFFNQRGYLEVETPILASHGVTDVYLSNIQAKVLDKPYYLQTSPEYPMKRLLAAGSGPIFQIARVFREDELGRWHNPEFTMLEWYQLGIDHHALMEEVGALLTLCLNCGSFVKKTYQSVFLEYCGFCPFTATLSQLQQTVTRFGLSGVLPETEEDKDQYLFLLMSFVIEPQLAQAKSPIIVYDYPASQAALAKISQGVAERFEVYYQGIELANGFHELTNPTQQAARFAEDIRLRKQKGLPLESADPYLLKALQKGLPPCSGVALGIDRLMAFAFDQPSIAKVLAFDFSRM